MKKILQFLFVVLCVGIFFQTSFALSADKNILKPYKITKKNPPSISSKSVVVMDADTGKILYSKSKDLTWRPASLTKLMTAMVALDQNPNWKKKFTYKNIYDAIGGVLRIREGETLTLNDIFFSTLVGSANNTANSLPNSLGMKNKAFLQKMNEKTKVLGMNKTTFVDLSGLSEKNFTTAYDMAILVKSAGEYKKIQKASATSYYRFSTLNTKKYHSIKNTNALLGITPYQFLVGKTGYIDEAMYNNAVEISNKKKNKIIIVVLGAQSTSARFHETDILAQYIYKNYTWKVITHEP